MMPDQQTIDRVAVGLAEITLTDRQLDRHLGAPEDMGDPRPYRLLVQLIGWRVDDGMEIPIVAQEALEGHHGTPEELVAVLRGLAVENIDPKLPDDLPRAVCEVCSKTIVCVPTGLGEGDETWIHELPASHRPKPKGETE